ncbi:MAG TPA: FTR1 family protein [Myxococcales bacterium]|nr:FTR1 family protein [Myxococcales bacterium]
MLRLILIFSLIAAGASAQPGQNLRRAVALLDYVGGDYAQAVGAAGEVLSENEFTEQQHFVAEAAQELREEAGPAGADLAQRLDTLHARIEARAPPAEVVPRARAIRDEIAQRFHVALLPTRPPDLSRGAQLYAQACAACHGRDGHAPPKESLELPTQPTSFASGDEMKALGPQRVFSASTYGVPNTAMPGFEEAFDDAARWDLAYFVFTLAHPPPADAERGHKLAHAALLPSDYRELATQSDEALKTKLDAAGLNAHDAEEALAALRGGPFASARDMSSGLAETRREIQKAVAQAAAGDRPGAKRTIISAYLDHFEPHEPALRARDPGLVSDIEREFLAMRAALDFRGPRGGPPRTPDGPRGNAADDPRPPAARLDALLEKADVRGPGGTLIAFVAALVIALREGVEAALLVAALLALLRKAGRTGDAHAVHFGWVAALGAGGLTWWASGALLGISGAQREIVEGVLKLVTAALLLYASHWLLAAATARRVVSFLSTRTLQAGSAVVVFGLAFVAIYREMFEVVLFFRGLLLESPGEGAAVALGALVGLLVLVALVAAFQKLGRRLKPRPLLLTCGVLLCALSVFMVGNGVRSLQEAGVVPLTVWGGFEVPALGVYATREGLLAQAIVLVLLGASAVWTGLRGRQGGNATKGRAPAAA